MTKVGGQRPVPTDPAPALVEALREIVPWLEQQRDAELIPCPSHPLGEVFTEKGHDIVDLIDMARAALRAYEGGE